MTGFDDFVIARNPDEASTLPYLARLPLPSGAIVLKVRDTWPRTAKIYCHRSDDWPPEPEIVERVPVRSCRQRGAAIDLVLDRGRENRSQFVFTKARGRDMIFWQSARTRKQARPNVSVPTARASGLADLTISSTPTSGTRGSSQPNKPTPFAANYRPATTRSLSRTRSSPRSNGNH